MLNRLLRIIVIFLFAYGFSHASVIQVIPDSTSYYTNQLDRAIKQHKLYPNRSYGVLKKSHNYFSQQKDTSLVVKCLMNMAEIQLLKGKYSLSFDHSWEGLYLSKNAELNEETAKLHIRLGRLYDIFSMNDEVFYHFNEALGISKDIYFENEEDVDQLIASYMNLAVKERKLENYKIALKHLDSCLVNETVVENKQVEMPFIDAERGYIMLRLGVLNEAERLLHSASKNTDNKPVHYRTNISMYLGELKTATNELDSAAFYYNKGLRLIRAKNYRSDLMPDILRKLSQVYNKKQQYVRAYNYLEQSRKVADSMLQLRNITNGELFEIKDGYLKSLSQKNEQLAEQELLIAENELVQFRLKIILGLTVFLIVALSVVYRMRLKLKRTLLDKKETELQAKVKEEQSKAQIESKSKELTSYALQLIDKEKDIDELLQVLKEESPSSYKAMSYKYTKGSKDLWDSFNLRFTEVNSQFYEKLKDQHPDLSVTERKHCALIKLNFGTKEMARILNIEPHSVHISRSRIRKKIGLDRSAKLENYIANL